MNSNSIIVNWMRVGELLKIYSQGNPIPFKSISVKLLEDIKMFLLRAPMGGNKKGTISQNTASTYFSIVKAGLKQAFIDEYLTVDISAKVKGISSIEAVVVQQKTKKLDCKPVTAQALQLCGERPDDDERLVFEGLTDISWISHPLKEWIEASGIKKHVTFHCGRHSFASLLLENGVDIYTIKSLMGHTNVKTTQIYTHIVDAAKEKAANTLHIDNLPV